MHANRHQFRVIYGDTDQMGVVYYANYLRYFEAGRNELLRKIGLSYIEMEASGYMLPVAEAHVRYKMPARYDDQLTLETKIVEVRHATVRIGYRLVRSSTEELLVTGETTHVCVGASGRATRFPDEIRAKISSE